MKIVAVLAVTLLLGCSTPCPPCKTIHSISYPAPCEITGWTETHIEISCDNWANKVMKVIKED